MPEIRVDETRCKECSLCVEACPKKCIAISDTFCSTGYHPATLAKKDCCIGCGMCAQICPDMAITVYR